LARKTVEISCLVLPCEPASTSAKTVAALNLLGGGHDSWTWPVSAARKSVWASVFFMASVAYFCSTDAEKKEKKALPGPTCTSATFVGLGS